MIFLQLYPQQPITRTFVNNTDTMAIHNRTVVQTMSNVE